MKLITRKLEQRFEQIGSQDGKGLDTIVIVKFFNLCGSWTWYATEFNAEDGIFFGYVDGTSPEWGYFSLAEFHKFNKQAKHNHNIRRLGLGIERDVHCGEKILWEHLKSSKHQVLKYLESD